MSIDPIVDEVRRIREQYAATFNYDLAAIADDLRKSRSKAVEKSSVCQPNACRSINVRRRIPRRSVILKSGSLLAR